jgi:hypothetical protein
MDSFGVSRDVLHALDWQDEDGNQGSYGVRRDSISTTSRV